MANVHRIGDYANDNDANRPMMQRRPMGMGGMMGGGNDEEDPRSREDEANNPISRAYSRNSGDPRQENFWQMLKIVFCPGFTFKSFIAVITIIDVWMFIASLAKSNGLSNDDFLGIKTQTLWDLGAKDSYKLHSGQVQRWILPMVLHGGFLHLLMNCVIQLIIGSLFEVILGPLRVMIIYILSGLGGILMGALINDNVSVGASTAIFGINGGLIAFIIVNWIAMENIKELRCWILCMLIMFTLINVLFGLSSTENIDNYGHLGGFITGLFISMPLMIVLPTSMGRHQMPGMTYEKYCKYIGGVVWFLWIVGGITGFYLARHPNPKCL